MIRAVQVGAFGRGLQGETIAAPTVNPWANARATVDKATAAFESMSLLAWSDLYPPGFQLFEESAGYWKTIQYPASIYACTPENMRHVSFRGDFWMAAQRNLIQLYAVAKATFLGKPLPEVGTPERRYVAALFADWYVATMSWVSLAAFGTNIQPAFLCPDDPTTPPENGLLKPKRTAGNGLPQQLVTLRNELKGLDSNGLPGNAFVTKYMDEGLWGPMWQGFYDFGEATGWLRREFKPHTDPAAQALQQGNGGVDAIWPNRSPRPLPPGTTWATVRKNITDPWYQVYYSLLWFGWDDLIAPWQQRDTTGVNSVTTRHLLAPASLQRIGEAWILWVTNQTIMDVILTSSSWYSTSYMRYWDKKGLLTFSPSQAAAAQKELLRQKQAVKQQAASSTVNTIMQTGASLTVALAAVPWAGAVAAAGAFLVAGITALICRRRRKKKLTVPLMQPLMLRTLSDPLCNYFPPDATLEGSMKLFLDQVKTQLDELDRAPGGLVPQIGTDDPLYAGIVPPSQPAPTVSPSASSFTSTGTVASGPAINTSTSAELPPGTIIPSVQELAQAAVQASQMPPVNSGVARPPGQIPWGVIGVGGVAVAALLLLRRR